jgi:hypothetical protein
MALAAAHELGKGAAKCGKKVVRELFLNNHDNNFRASLISDAVNPGAAIILVVLGQLSVPIWMLQSSAALLLATYGANC